MCTFNTFPTHRKKDYIYYRMEECCYYHCRISGSVVSRLRSRLQQGHSIWPQWHWNNSSSAPRWPQWQCARSPAGLSLWWPRALPAPGGGGHDWTHSVHLKDHNIFILLSWNYSQLTKCQLCVWMMMVTKTKHWAYGLSPSSCPWTLDNAQKLICNSLLISSTSA